MTGESEVEVNTINNAQTMGGMRHGLHAEPECISKFKEWIPGAKGAAGER
jgi:hypothetical protein